MDKVSVFESSDFGELRIIVDPKGDVWFVASDVAKSLGYINAKDAVKVVAVSEPRYLPPQPGQYQAMQTRVVDLTVELTGETKTYTVPESQNVAKAMGITLSTSIDPIMNELNAIKSTSQEIIDSVDAHRAKIEACESILEDINPAFKQTREQDRKIAGIENKVNDLTDSFEDLKKLIVERLK